MLNINVKNNKIKEIKNIKFVIKKKKKLFHRRKINSSQKSFKGKKELNIQFLIGCYKPNESLPIFSLGKLRFKYIYIDADGYLKKCPQLFELSKKVAENVIHHL